MRFHQIKAGAKAQNFLFEVNQRRQIGTLLKADVCAPATDITAASKALQDSLKYMLSHGNQGTPHAKKPLGELMSINEAIHTKGGKIGPRRPPPSLSHSDESPRRQLISVQNAAQWCNAFIRNVTTTPGPENFRIVREELKSLGAESFTKTPDLINQWVLAEEHNAPMPSQPPTATKTQLQTPKHHLQLHIAKHHPQCTSPHKHRLPSTPMNTSNESMLVPPLETARAQNLTLALPCTTGPTGTERKGNAGARSTVDAHAHYAETCTIKEPGGSDPSKMWPKHRPISQRCENELLAHQRCQPCKLACSVRRKRHSMDPNAGHQVHGYPLEAHERSTLRAPQFSQEEEDREYGSTNAPPTASSNARGYSDTHATHDATTNFDAYDASYDAPLPMSNAQPDAAHAYPNLSSDLINSSRASYFPHVYGTQALPAQP